MAIGKLRGLLFGCISLLFSSCIPQASGTENERFLSGWLSSSGTTRPQQTQNAGGAPPRLSDRYLPASLQVLEHVADNVNTSAISSRTFFSSQSPGSGVMSEGKEPMPGLVRLTILRNSLLSEAKAVGLAEYDGFAPSVESTLQATSESPLSEQLAEVLEQTLKAGELNEVADSSRRKDLAQLTSEVIQELRNPHTDIARLLQPFESLRYTA